MRRGPRGISVLLSEDFARWREDPMTRMVLEALQRAEDAQKQQWDEASWGKKVVRGDDLERMLLELTTRADAYASLREMKWPDVAAWLELDDGE